MARVIGRIFRGLRKTLKWVAVLVVTVLTIVLAVVLGYVFGWHSQPAPAKTASDALSVSPQEAIMKPTPSTPSESPMKDRLIEARAMMRYGNDRSLAAARAFFLIEEIPASQLEEAFIEACALVPLSSLERESVARMILRRWSRFDPAAAFAACFERVHSKRDSGFFLHSVQMGLAYEPLLIFSERDPWAAFEAWKEYAATRDVGYADTARFLLSGVFKKWVERDFDSAVAVYETLEPKFAKYALRGLVDAPVEHRDRVLEILENKGDAEALASARERIITRMARHGQAEKAVEWLEGFEMDDATRATLEEKLAEDWAWNEPQKAAAWVLSSADDRTRPSRIETIVDRWAEWEANRAGEWLGQMVDAYGAQADLGVREFARAIARNDPETSLEWLAIIQDDEIRKRGARRVGMEFARGIVEGAEEMVERSELSERDREALLKGMKER